MKLDLDTIQLESRHEIVDLQTVLDEWLKAHSDRRDTTQYRSAERLLQMLEVMYISW